MVALTIQHGVSVCVPVNNKLLEFEFEPALPERTQCPTVCSQCVQIVDSVNTLCAKCGHLHSVVYHRVFT